MKHLYVGFGEPCRIIIDDYLLTETYRAQRAVRMLPWRCEMFLPVDMTNIKTGVVEHAEICIGKDQVSVVVEGPDGRENLLTPNDDLLTVPDIYLSRDFEYSLEDNVFSLNSVDVDLITTWKSIKTKKLADSGNF